MQRRPFRLTGLAAMTLVPLVLGSTARGETHLFILSGQSNMAGLKPEISFTPTVTKLLAPDEVIVVKSAQGGQPIRRWYKKWAPAKGAGPAADGKLYEALVAAVAEGVGERKVDTMTFVWMQGERDAREQHGDVYRASLEGLISQLHQEYELKPGQLNVVVGRLSDNQTTPHWELVRKAQVAVGEAGPSRAWVDTDDLNGPKNGLHYTAEGYEQLGERFAEAAVKLVRRETKTKEGVAENDEQSECRAFRSEFRGLGSAHRRATREPSTIARASTVGRAHRRAHPTWRRRVRG